MRNTIWNYIYLWQINLCYYNRWRCKLEFRNFLLKFGSALATMVVIAFLGLCPSLFILWTTLVTLGQAANLYTECTGLSEKVKHLRYWIENAQKIINKITALWYEVDKINKISDSEMLNRLQALQDAWSALDARFLNGINPYDSKVLMLAEKEANDFMKNIYIANHEIYAESQ